MRKARFGYYRQTSPSLKHLFYEVNIYDIS